MVEYPYMANSNDIKDSIVTFSAGIASMTIQRLSSEATMQLAHDDLAKWLFDSGAASHFT